MKLLNDRDARFQWLSAKVGFFALFAVTLAILLVLGIALKQGYFANKVALHFEAQTGADLKEGMAVKLSGFKIGFVDSVVLNDAARVDVGLQIEDKYMKWIRSDSRVSIAKEGVIGDSVIEVTTGTLTKPQLQAGDAIAFAESAGVTEIAEDLHKRVIPVINQLSETLNYVNSPQGDVRQTLQNLNRFSSDLNKALAKLDSTLGHLDKVSGQDLPAVLSDTRAVLGRVDKSLSAVESRLPGLLDGAKRSMDNVEGATADARQASSVVRRSVEEVSPQLPGAVGQSRALLENGNQLLESTQGTLNALKRSWPLNRVQSAPDELPLLQSGR